MDGDAALAGEFDCVTAEVEEDLAEAAGVAAESGGDFRGYEAGEFEVFFLGFDAEEFGGFLDGGDEVEVDFFHFEAIGFDFGVIEDVIDEGEEAFGAGADDFCVAVLFVGEGGIEEEAGHTDDAVHGRTDFVGHTGEELAFGDIGGLGFGGEEVGFFDGEFEFIGAAMDEGFEFELLAADGADDEGSGAGDE
ncbi:MAG: hypothetical protein RI897_775 [Verrucomicrobiota bacterium]